MHKLMCTFMTPMKKKIPDRNLDTSCPAGIPCKKNQPLARCIILQFVGVIKFESAFMRSLKELYCTV